MKIKKGDTVQVLTGKDKGATGKVIAVNRETGRVTVEGVNRVTRHTKAGQSARGSRTGGLVALAGRAVLGGARHGVGGLLVRDAVAAAVVERGGPLRVLLIMSWLPAFGALPSHGSVRVASMQSVWDDRLAALQAAAEAEAQRRA